MPKWTANDMPNQSGKIVLVTGGNSGLGLESTRALSAAGAHVILAARSEARGDAARTSILKRHPDASIAVMRLDLSSLTSVADFAEAFRARHNRLDILMNNAGIMATPRKLTEDGFESQFGVNHLGHFALTGRLMPLLLATPGARVVGVSSFWHTRGQMNFDDLQREHAYTPYDAYGQSKLANLLFVFELTRRAAAAGADVIGLGTHPGYTATNLQGTSAEASGSALQKFAYAFSNAVIAQSVTMGTLPQLYAATMPDARGGDYWGPRRNLRGYPERVRAADQAYNTADAARLWEVSEALTGVRYAFDRAPSPTR